MNFDREKLLSLLPSLYRIRDAAIAAELGTVEGPLETLLGVMSEQIAVIEEDLEQLQDDAFIETCADWVVPYIGDLIGYRTLYGVAPKVANARAEVAHTIAYRRRKGTALVLEQLARDVTGWNASAVEYFQRIITSQYMNHRRAWLHAAPDLRRHDALGRVDTAFDAIPRSIDVRRIAGTGIRGKHNIPNVGIFLWPLDAQPFTRSPAVRVDARRWRISPLNHDQPLVTRPQTEDEISQLATPLNAPVAIGRREMHDNTADFYSIDALRRSVRIYMGVADPLPAVALADLCVCNLSDAAGTWAHLPAPGKVAIDPVLGRIALPAGLPAATRVQVDYHHAFGAALGGGEYERADSFASTSAATVLRVPQDHATIQAALTALAGEGIVEITDSGRYEETPSIVAAAGKRIELRAANGHRPTLVLGAEMNLAGGADSEIAINGLLICGHQLHAAAGAGNALRRLVLRHATVVPGRSLAPDATPQSPLLAGLVIDVPGLQVSAERCILAALRVVAATQAGLRDCVLDATSLAGVAYAAPDGVGVGGPLSLDACTTIGKLHAQFFPLVSNSILLAETTAGDGWAAPIIAQRRQQGCVRFSYAPTSARLPRRYRCVPGADTTPSPVLRFASLRYGVPMYAQLGEAASSEVRHGADDEGEMGAYHHLHRPQRETNLRLRLDEYLRVGLEAGVFFQT